MLELHSLCTATIVIALGSLGLAGCGSDVDATPGKASGSSTATSGGGGEGGGMGTGGEGTGGMGTGGGTGGGGAACTPEGPFDGQPVDAPANTWTWVPVPEAKCRTGSETGFGVRINPGSTKLVIYLQGGGACFNGLSCLQNPGSFGSSNFDSWKTGSGKSGIFDATNADNAVEDASFVFVPYCTGDVHAGNATGVDLSGVGTPKGQSFVGHANIGHYLKRIIPTFKGVTEVLLTGESAGGFGAFYNYDRVAQAFCPTPVALVDDSGPPMSDQYLPPCLQQRWRTLWNLDATLPPGCDGCANADGGGLVNAYTLLAKKYPQAHLGLVSSDKDSVISLFYGFGQNDCANIDGLPQSLPGATYAAGLAEVRDKYLKPWPAWSSYTISSTQHTWIGGGSYASTTVQGVKLIDWVAGVVDGAPSAHVGP